MYNLHSFKSSDRKTHMKYNFKSKFLVQALWLIAIIPATQEIEGLESKACLSKKKKKKKKI
jgi:hypothetical protein